jgi:hypothetical protein
MMKPSEMPAPDALIEHENGTIEAAMFHYLGEGMQFAQVANEHGFDCQGLSMETDLDPSDELHVLYFIHGEYDNILARWNPTPPAGWQLAAKMDGEDGPFATFIRPKEPADGKSQLPPMSDGRG